MSPPRFHRHPSVPLERRSDISNSTYRVIGLAIAVVCIIILVLASFVLLRNLRKRHENPKYVPTKRLKKLWRKWSPQGKRYSTTLEDWRSVQYARRSASPTSTLRAMRSSAMMGERSNHSARNSTAGLNPDPLDTSNNPDRRVSVRSIMTLPVYSEDAKPTEKVIAREGERAGVDTVIEYPETGEEEESRREEEMQSLYQIREARRNERADREERRRLRREARSRGDRNTLEELRRQARLRAGSGSSLNGTESTAAALMAEHVSRDRGRRISSVSYADLGVARHDGSRVRGDSNDSNRPLIESAPSFDNRRGSGPYSPLGHHTHGNQSTSSLRFVTQDISDDEGAGSDLEYVPTPPWGSRRPSASNLREGGPDLGIARIPHPPAYEADSRSSTPTLAQLQTEAPRYRSFNSATAPQLPAFAPLPDIDISGPAGPEAAADEQDFRGRV